MSEPNEAWMQGESQSFDAWLTSDLRQRFGEPEPLPHDWLDLVDAAQYDA